jgi:UDP-N-acetylglucosamine:LPS N-acetylglucosamine transferase
LLSGPDPQHADLLNKVLALAKNNHSKKIAVVTSKKTEAVIGAEVFQLPDNKKLSELIASSKQIICRSGYSTLMDMYLLEKKDLVLIPTKGQTEQEYLAEHWKTHFNAIILNEDKLNNYNL